MKRLIYTLKVLSIGAPLYVIWLVFYFGRDIKSHMWALFPLSITSAALVAGTSYYAYVTAKRLFELDI